jgi:ABC-2 type transport system permease protein
MIKKILIIALKDLKLAFRDPTALLLMFVAPIALTMIMGFAFGGSDDGPAIEHIPVVVVNHDSGQFSPFLVEALNSADLDTLLDSTTLESDAEARKAVDENRAVAAILIPDGFSNAIMPAGILDRDVTATDITGLQNPTPAEVVIYGDPASQVSVFVVRSVINTILMDFNSSTKAGELVFGQMLSDQTLSTDQLQNLGQDEFQSLLSPILDSNPVVLTTVEVSPSSQQTFNWLSYSAAGMAILFLMFTMTSSARTILSEKQDGTLPRLMISPTNTFSVISGKMMGVFFIGLAQMLVLILASHFLFKIQWGKPLDVLIFTILLTAAAASWGIFIAAVSKSPGQVSSMGTAVNLLFAAIGGSFVPRFNMPEWLKTASLFTPNALGIEGLTKLVEGGSLSTIQVPILGCLITIGVLLTIATLSFHRQYQ